jgi:CheY-like chemotaxis protein
VRALVVDDEPSLVRAIAGYLQHEGYTVDTAADGEAALATARTVPPDVVVLDLMLPGIDGIEVCRRLRTFSDAYVIMLTARTEEVDKLIGLSVGADDYLTKPFSPRELVARVKVMLRRPRTAQRGGRFAVPDWYAFTLSFKGVVLEGLEVAFIVVTFGANQGRLGLAVLAAAAAVVLVAGAGVAVRRPLARVPENTMKFAVGTLLTSFGVFWGAEGVGAHWPAGDGAILGLLTFTLAVSLAAVAILRRTARPATPEAEPATIEVH